MDYTRETLCFLHIVKNVLSADGFYLLPVREHHDVQPDKILMGYYDEKFIYLIPKRIVYCCDEAMEMNEFDRLNIKRVLETLFALDLIKVQWVLSKEVRYRPQKRIWKTRGRYITLIRSRFENFFKEDNK